MMKKLLAVLLVALGLAVLAPSSQAQGFYLGVKGGMNVSSISHFSYGTAKVGLNAGVMAGYQLSPNVALQAEALYSFQGYGIDPSVVGIPLSPVNLDYFKIPVLAKIYLLGGLNAEVGLSFNFLTSALQASTPIKGLNEVDISIPIGVAYGIGRSFEVGVRYDISLMDVSPYQKGANGLFSLNLSWRLW